MHFLREGQFSVAATFLDEIKQAKTHAQAEFEDTGASSNTSSLLLDQIQSSRIREEFTTMYHILHELREQSNLLPAIEWAREHRELLEARGSNLEFELCRLQFVWLFHGGKNPDCPSSVGRQAALRYARMEFSSFTPRYLKEIQQLIGAMAFWPNLDQSPYRHIFNNTTAWTEVAQSFTREFCSLLGLSADSPLYIAATAGAIALPTLLKLQTIMKAKRTEWTTQDELPVCIYIYIAFVVATNTEATRQVEIPLPRSYLFHSIFVCPVSKEQTTDQNPPMMMPCGHVIAQESLQRISKGNKFKCPYCPSESHPKNARKVIF